MLSMRFGYFLPAAFALARAAALAASLNFCTFFPGGRFFFQGSVAISAGF